MEMLADIANTRDLLLAEFESTTGRVAADEPNWFASDIDLAGRWWTDQTVADSILLPAFIPSHACDAL